MSHAKRGAGVLAVLAFVVSCAGHGHGPLPSIPSSQQSAVRVSETTSGYVDWNTFGFSLDREGYNPSETTLSTSSVGGLKELWSTDLGGAITDQALVAAHVMIANVPRNVVYIGAENNVFYALDADTGAVIWQNTALGSPQQSTCGDLPGKQFGITGTATFDRKNGVIYVADATDHVSALSMTTGKIRWRANILIDPSSNAVVGTPRQDHIYGALAFNPSNGLLYAYTSSFCDHAPWFGRIVAVDTTAHKVVSAFFPGRSGSGVSGTAYCGGGIWGMGGASIAASTNDVLVATGNSSGGTGCVSSPSETFPYGDSVVQLDQNLNLISYKTANIGGNFDSDYGATPMLYKPAGCSLDQSSTKNKNGSLFTYSVGAALRYKQQLKVGQVSSDGRFIGVPAYDPTLGLVFVGNPVATGTFANGLNAFSESAGCAGLTAAWQAPVTGPTASGNDNQAPSVANGVVFLTDGIGDHLWAFNDATGAELWQSGTAIGTSCSYGTTCGAFAAPTVDKNVYVGSFNHRLYAFGV